MHVVTRVIRRLMKHGNSQVLALPPEMREEIGLQPHDTVAIYQLKGALLVIPLRTLQSGQAQRTLEALLMNQD